MRMLASCQITEVASRPWFFTDLEYEEGPSLACTYNEITESRDPRKRPEATGDTVHPTAGGSTMKFSIAVVGLIR